MLDTVDSQPQTLFYEGRDQGLDVTYLLGVIRRRAFYFLIPFLLVAMSGLAVTELQQPIYRAEGKMLVESSGISSDLLHPLISELIDQRFEVYKERMLAADNLLATVDKFNLFPGMRDRLSRFELLELMRKRVAITPAPLQMQPNSPTAAFSVSFDYEVPEIALRVDNEFLKEILTQDTSRRTTNALQTVQLLEDQVTKLKHEYDAVVAQLEVAKQRPPDRQQAISEEVKAQMSSLAALETELIQKSSIYSDEHPIIKKLKKDIALLRQTITTAPQKAAVPPMANQADALTQVLVQRETIIEKNLDDARNKLAVARLGESLEKNQQAEHLQIIQYPELPGKPIRPRKLIWLAISLALAGTLGAVSAFLAEMLDRSIRSKKELAGFIDPSLIVSIPYLLRPGEQLRRRLKYIVLCLILVAVTGVTTSAIILLKAKPIDFAQVHSVSR